MKKRLVTIIVIGMTTFLLTSCAQAANEKHITIAAAASLTDVMDEIIPLFEKEYNIEVDLTLASSGKLARQIEQGAPVDVFLSADTKWTTYLKERGLINDSSYYEFASNQIVVVGRPDHKAISHIDDLKQLPSDIEIAVGNPESVPAGTYTKEALETIQIWEQLKGSMVFGSDVRHVLTYVETGEVDYGMVYNSDAVISEKAEVKAEFDTNLHKPILYSGVTISESRTEDEARQFFSFLREEPKVRETLKDFGFTNTAGGM
ncbi:molybdate ABC transporter substrate-binding protein [Halobacillus litoralis]|uniref:molybdate ABC transporter substrate-binding protein n=1 Tax=Halobacillus litoralis TaxID=45668 RepID=UPI001CFCBD68|nr:molybdate ABC transporter substrate-binding protein [Halobacillus litoralis]